MRSPNPRIWIYPVTMRDIEIVLLGEPIAVATMHAQISEALSRWRGFSSVDTLVMGVQVVGFRARRNDVATHDDPLAEALLMLRQFNTVEWSTGDAGSHRLGAVGEWI